MKAREFAKLARRHLMPELPNFALKDGLLYAVPVEQLLRGMNFYASAFDCESFTIYCTVTPLYVPDSAGAVLPGLGDRLPILAGRGDRWWDWKVGNERAEKRMMADILDLIQRIGVPFLNRIQKPHDVAEALLEYPTHAESPHSTEARAYSLILAGRYDLAMEALALLRRITLENGERAAWWADLNADSRKEPEEDWVVTVGRRGERIRAILADDPEKALELLELWRAEQFAGLRLPKTAR